MPCKCKKAEDNILKRIDIRHRRNAGIKKEKNKMKKILGLGMVAILVMALVGGGTWAYFSDTETSSDNVLAAGTLDLGLGNTSGSEAGTSVTATWTTPTGFKPGDTLDKTLYLKNSGTIAMTSVNVTFGQVYSENTPTTVSGYNQLLSTTGNLTNMLKATTATWNGTATSFQGHTLTALTTTDGSMNLGSIAPGAEATLHIIWTFDTAATNGCQGDSSNITLTIGAIQ
jgi:spore coat-associated protein N